LQCVAMHCSVLQRVAVCCSVLQCVAVCCSVLQCVAVCCSAHTMQRCVLFGVAHHPPFEPQWKLVGVVKDANLATSTHTFPNLQMHLDVYFNIKYIFKRSRIFCICINVEDAYLAASTHTFPNLYKCVFLSQWHIRKKHYVYFQNNTYTLV